MINSLYILRLSHFFCISCVTEALKNCSCNVPETMFLDRKAASICGWIVAELQSCKISKILFPRLMDQVQVAHIWICGASLISVLFLGDNLICEQSKISFTAEEKKMRLAEASKIGLTGSEVYHSL